MTRTAGWNRTSSSSSILAKKPFFRKNRVPCFRKSWWTELQRHWMCPFGRPPVAGTAFSLQFLRTWRRLVPVPDLQDLQTHAPPVSPAAAGSHVLRVDTTGGGQRGVHLEDPDHAGTSWIDWTLHADTQDAGGEYGSDDGCGARVYGRSAGMFWSMRLAMSSRSPKLPTKTRPLLPKEHSLKPRIPSREGVVWRRTGQGLGAAKIAHPDISTSRV
jgi:hypothetical protein